MNGIMAMIYIPYVYLKNPGDGITKAPTVVSPSI